MQMLRDLRKAEGLTMKSLGAIVGVAESTISQYETGKREPDYETLRKLADHFNVSVDYLLGRDNTAEKAPTPQGERRATEYEIKFALFGGAEEITDEMYEEVKRFAEYVKQRNAMLKKKKGEE